MNKAESILQLYKRILTSRKSKTVLSLLTLSSISASNTEEYAIIVSQKKNIRSSLISPAATELTKIDILIHHLLHQGEVLLHTNAKEQ